MGFKVEKSSLWEVGIMLIWSLDGVIIDKACSLVENATSLFFIFYFYFFRIGSQ